MGKTPQVVVNRMAPFDNTGPREYLLYVEIERKTPTRQFKDYMAVGKAILGQFQAVTGLELIVSSYDGLIGFNLWRILGVSAGDTRQIDDIFFAMKRTNNVIDPTTGYRYSDIHIQIEQETQNLAMSYPFNLWLDKKVSRSRDVYYARATYVVPTSDVKVYGDTITRKYSPTSGDVTIPGIDGSVTFGASTFAMTGILERYRQFWRIESAQPIDTVRTVMQKYFAKEKWLGPTKIQLEESWVGTASEYDPSRYAVSGNVVLNRVPQTVSATTRNAIPTKGVRHAAQLKP